MRRAFKASDEGGTGLVGVADFRKVSQLSASVPVRAGSRCQESPENLHRGGPCPAPEAQE